MSAGVDSLPAAAAANSVSSGMLPQMRYERREAISQSSRRTTCVGFGAVPSVTATEGSLAVGTRPNSIR